MTRRLAGGAVWVVVVAIGMWLTVRGCSDGEPSVPPDEQGSVDQGAIGPAAATRATAEDRGVAEGGDATGHTFEREAVAAVGDPAPGTGSLLVTLIWGNDDSPVVGFEVHASRGWADNRLDMPSGVTDDMGQVLFRDLRPGELRPRWQRGVKRYGEPVDIVAGEQARSVIVVPVGLTARGVVVDGNARPVADAEIIVLGQGAGPQLVGRSGVDGAFLVRGLPARCSIGARGAGYAPSPMRVFTTNGEVEVTLTIELCDRGGAIAGQVLGPDGEPVAGAMVRVGRPSTTLHQLPDGGRGRAPQPVECRSDDAGRFLADGVAPGAVEVLVRAPRLAPSRQVVEVGAGRTTSVALHLLRGAEVFGRVADAAGGPVSSAILRARSASPRHSWMVTSKHDGTFALDGLAAGEIEVTVEHDRHGSARAAIELRTGERREWRPILGRGLALRGVVLDVDGAPVVNAEVRGRLDPWVRGANWYPRTTTDKDGGFVLEDCQPGHTVRIEARGSGVLFPEVVVRGVRPSESAIEVRLPVGRPGFVSGVVRGPNNSVLPSVRCSPALVGDNSGRPKLAVDSTTGEFRFGRFPPGRYRLTFSADGYPPVRVTGEVGAGATWDLGTVHFAAGGRVAIRVGGTMTPPAELRVVLTDERGEFLRWLTLHDGRGEWGPLAVGHYRLAVFGKDYAAAASGFEIAKGLTVNATLTLAAGRLVTLGLSVPTGEARAGPVDVRIHDAAGELVHRSDVHPRDGRRQRAVRLAAGTYQMAARWHEHSATRAIVVGADDQAIEVLLR